MKALIFSDIHLDAVTAGMRRIEDLEKDLTYLVETAEKEKVDYVFFLGDAADPDCGSILIRVIYLLIKTALEFSRRGIKSFWIAGNHDVVEDGSGYTPLTPLRNFWDVGCPPVVIEEPTRLILGKRNLVEVWFLPFVSRSKLYDASAFMQEKKWTDGAKKVVLGHCTGLDGVIVGSESRDMSRGAELRFPIEECRKQRIDFMANGHFHMQQMTDDFVHIPGSLERLRFDEESHSPGFLIVEV